MIVYLCGILFYAVFIPLYSFWHFDDFSWGNTRLVVEDGQKKEVEAEPEPFNPADIPVKKWSDFEIERQEKLETQSEASFHSHGSFAQPTTAPAVYAGSAYAGSAYAASAYGAPAVGVPLGGMVQVVVPSAPPSLYAASAYGLPPVAPASIAGPAAFSVAGAPYPVVGGGSVAGDASAAARTSWLSQSSGARGAGQPSDEELLMQIRQILATADLMTVTRKSVREELSRVFGVDLSARKEYIHRCIDSVLKSEI
ncbi:hypothetical protein HK405_007124 [Cladochytrium tenue]|nr:hypothetical protein HK405_007124 [Cladochytrium tenue]